MQHGYLAITASPHALGMVVYTSLNTPSQPVSAPKQPA